MKPFNFSPVLFLCAGSISLPGTHVTPAAMALFVSGLFIVIRTINRIANCPTGDLTTPIGGGGLPDIRR